MAIDRADYVSQLSVAAPADLDPRSEGAGQIRAVKVAVKNTFPEVDGEVKGTAKFFNDGLRSQYVVGMIIPWFGDKNSLPEGWALCDGKTHGTTLTPDLRGKYLAGATDEQSKGDKFGNNNPLVQDVLSIEPITLTPENIPELEVGMYDKNNKERELVINQGRADNGNSVGTYTDERFNGRAEGLMKTKGTKGTAINPKIVGKVNAEGEAVKFDNRPETVAVHWIMFVGFTN